MTKDERMDTLAKIEGLTNRAADLAAAAKLIEEELVRLQAAFYQQTQEAQQNG